MVRRFKSVNGKYIEKIYGQDRLAFAMSDNEDLYDLIAWSERWARRRMGLGGCRSWLFEAGAHHWLSLFLTIKHLADHIDRKVLYLFRSLCSGFWLVWASYYNRLTCSPAAQGARTL